VARTPDDTLRGNAAEDDPETATPQPEPMRVLIVDDSEAVRDGLSLLLNSRPYCAVVGAVDEPRRALSIALEAEPHVVLLDFSMPLVDPLALTAELATCRPRPAVLMLSALANEQSAARASAAGAVGWVLKDSEPDALFNALLRAARTGDPGWEPPASVGADVLARVARPVGGKAGAVGDGAGGDGGAASAVAADGATKVDARTVRALLRALRALQGDLMGATAADLAADAVVSPRAAERILKRLLGRQPPLVALVELDSAACRYVLTPAGEQELERLERHAGDDAEASRQPCGAR
jgi:CheY-like chemotaxis protein